MVVAVGRFEVAGVAISPDHYIDGRRVASQERFEDYSPIDGALLARISAGGADAIALAVDAAQRAFAAWAALGPKGRLPYLERLAQLISERVPQIAAVESTDNGSAHEAMRERVIKRGAHNIEYFAQAALHLGEGESYEHRTGTATSRVRYEPSGVAALITPWNAPFMLSTWKVGPALASGCTAVLKPPEWAPLSCSLLADLADEAGLPPGVLNVVQGIGVRAGAALVQHPGIARISFTGSVPTARRIAHAAAENLTPLSLELGGKSPFLVFADADLELAVTNAIEQYDNGGQVCLSGTRLLVERGVMDEFKRRFVERARTLRIGSSLDDATEVTPLIHPDHLARVEGFIERARAEGAEPLFGGRRAEGIAGGSYYEPTLFVEPRAGSEILREEVFGPVLTLQAFDSEDDAVAMANDTDYGLAATIFTRDHARAERVAAAIVAGTVWVNCFYVRDLRVPFGGAKLSGVGREGGRHSFDFYCDLKTVCERHDTFAEAGA